MAKVKGETDVKDVLTTITKDNIEIQLVLMKKEKAGKKYRLVLTEDGEKYVAKLASFGCTMEEIADEFGVNVSTFRTESNNERFHEAFRKGASQFKTSIRVSQTRIMKKGSAPMAIFLGKNYLGQHDTVTQDIPATALAEFASAMREYKDDGN